MTAGADLTEDLARVGRSDLLAMVRRLREQVQEERDRNQQLDFNLTSVQTRCTELLLKVRELESGIVLPGWHCPKCHLFTGTERENHKTCRSCGTPRPQ